MDENHGMIDESGGSNGSPPVSSSTNSIPVDKKRKSIRPRSVVWEHFEKCTDSDGASKARCNYCSSSYAADTSSNGTSSLNTHLKKCKQNPHNISTVNSGNTHQGTLIQQEYLRHKAKSGRMDAKTELDKYLGEETEVANENFDILLWWKVNSPRFPVLAEMARDVLAIPVSTVASESAFSTGGRVLDSFRSSLTPKLVQTLVCLQDWLRKESSPIKVEEDLDNLERLESDLINNGRDSCIVDI